MRYAAVHRSWLIADPAALDADDRALGAWVRLSVHAADLELGLIVNFGERRLKDGLVRVLNPDKLNAMREGDHDNDDHHNDDHDT